MGYVGSGEKGRVRSCLGAVHVGVLQNIEGGVFFFTIHRFIYLYHSQEEGLKFLT